MAGPPGLNGPIVLCPVEGAFSSAAAPATASITTARARRCRRETATFRSVTSAVSAAQWPKVSMVFPYNRGEK